MLDSWKPSRLQTVGFLVAGGLAFAGKQFALPWATQSGLIGLGLLIMTIGIDGIAQRLKAFRRNGWMKTGVVETYRGLLDLVWGFVFILFGLIATAAVAITWFAPTAIDPSWLDRLRSRAAVGVILAWVGLPILLNGVIRTLESSGRVKPRRAGERPQVLDRLVGVVLLLTGLGVSAFGLMLLAVPGMVDAAAEWVWRIVLGI